MASRAAYRMKQGFALTDVRIARVPPGRDSRIANRRDNRFELGVLEFRDAGAGGETGLFGARAGFMRIKPRGNADILGKSGGDLLLQARLVCLEAESAEPRGLVFLVPDKIRMAMHVRLLGAGEREDRGVWNRFQEAEADERRSVAERHRRFRPNRAIGKIAKANHGPP